MNPQLNHMIAHQRSAELHGNGDRARLAREVFAGQRNLRHATSAALQHTERVVGETQFTLHGRHIARLDRFLGQAQRAALRAGRAFEGVSIQLDKQGTVSVHAIGMTSMAL